MGGKYLINDVTVSNSVFRDNDGQGILACYAQGLKLTDCVISGNTFGMDFTNDVTNVKCSGLTVTGNRGLGVSLVTAYQRDGLSDIVFESSIFSNNSQDWFSPTDGVRVGRFDGTGYIRNIMFTGCQFIDNQTVKTQGFGLTVASDGATSGIVVEKSCGFSGNIYGSYYGGAALKVL